MPAESALVVGVAACTALTMLVITARAARLNAADCRGAARLPKQASAGRE